MIKVNMSEQESTIELGKGSTITYPQDSESSVIQMDELEPIEDAEEEVDDEAHRAQWNRILLAGIYLFCISLLTWILGLITFLHTDSGDVSRYYPGIIVSCGAFLGVAGIQVIASTKLRSSAAQTVKAE